MLVRDFSYWYHRRCGTAINEHKLGHITLTQLTDAPLISVGRASTFTSFNILSAFSIPGAAHFVSCQFFISTMPNPRRCSSHRVGDGYHQYMVTEGKYWRWYLEGRSWCTRTQRQRYRDRPLDHTSAISYQSQRDKSWGIVISCSRCPVKRGAKLLLRRTPMYWFAMSFLHKGLVISCKDYQYCGSNWAQMKGWFLLSSPVLFTLSTFHTSQQSYHAQYTVSIPRGAHSYCAAFRLYRA